MAYHLVAMQPKPLAEARDYLADCTPNTFEMRISILLKAVVRANVRGVAIK